MRSYATFGIIFGTMELLAILLSFKDRNAWPTILMWAGVAAFTFVWLSRFKLVIDDSKVHYRSLTINRSVAISEIHSVEYKPFYLATSWGPTVRVEISLRDENAKKLIVNAGVLDREAVGALLRLAPRG